MATPSFNYQPMFEHGADTTEYYLLTKDYDVRAWCRHD